MTRALLLVSLHKGQWHIKNGAKRLGPYLTQKTAIRAAIEAAHRKARSQVLVQEPNGQIQPVWTEGEDPYPPKA